MADYDEIMSIVSLDAKLMDLVHSIYGRDIRIAGDCCYDIELKWQRVVVGFRDVVQCQPPLCPSARWVGLAILRMSNI